MAITPSVLQAFVPNTSDLAAYATASSYSPTAERMLFLNIGNKSASGTAPTVTGVSGGGVSTWSILTTVNPETRRRQTVAYAYTGASPGTGQITVTLSGTCTSCHMQLISVDGTKLTGTNGADAIVQTKTVAKGVASGADLPITFDSAWDAADNIALGFFYASSASATYGQITGFTELDEGGSGSADNAGSLMAQYGRDGANLTVGCTTTDTDIKSGIAIELAAYVDTVVEIIQLTPYRSRGINGRFN